jgi:hypothetical protein
MEDLLSMSKGSSFPHQERFLRSISTIQAQVRRGVDLSTRLNRLAHSPDKPLATVDLNELTDQLTLLVERFARMKGVDLKVFPADEPAPLYSSPVRLQMAFLAGLECVWNQMAGGGTLNFRVNKSEAGSTVGIRWDEQLADPGDFREKVSGSPEWDLLQEIMKSLGGEISWDASGCGLVLTFPAGE